MAAIARFVSFDGGIAFSERVMKIQNRGEEAVIIPLYDVSSVRVRRPREDSNGFIRVDTVDGRQYRIAFEDDDYQDAVEFSKAFRATLPDDEDNDYRTPAPKTVPPKQQRTQNDGRDTTRAYRESSQRPARKKRGIAPLAIAAVAVVAVVIIVVLIITKGGGGSKAKTPPNLVGNWTQTGGNSAESYQFATISGNTIEVYWYFEEDQTTSLYWAGSFVAPTTTDEPYTWDSVNDRQKTDLSLLASTDDTKTFTYDDGIISYPVSMMGVTSTVKLKRSGDGGQAAGSGDTNTTQPASSQKDFDGAAYSDMGEGTFALVNESGSTAGGNVIAVYAASDLMITQIGYEAAGINGGALSYIYVDGKLSTQAQVGDSQGAIDLQGDALAVGMHTVELVQYMNDTPSGNVTVYKAASYEVKGQ